MPHRRKAKYQHLAIIILIIGFLGSGLVAWQTKKNAELTDHQHFLGMTERVNNEISRRMALFDYGLRGARGLWPASQAVDRLEFTDMVNDRDLEKEFRGSTGIGFIRRVEREKVNEFLSATRADGSPDFEIKTSGNYPYLYVIEFIVPEDVNKAAIGYDVAEEKMRRDAAERAMLTGKSALTAPITLLQAPNEGPGFLVYIPIYEKGSKPQTEEERRKNLIGWTYMPIVASRILEGVNLSVQGELDFEIFHGTTISTDHLIFDADQHLDTSERQSYTKQNYAERHICRSKAIKIGGETWTVVCSTSEKFQRADRADFFGAAIGGAAITFLLTGLIYTLSRRSHRAHEMALKMTEELATTLKKVEMLAMVATRTTNVVTLCDVNRKITWVNEGFTRVTGYTLEEAIGKSPRELLQSELSDPETNLQMRASFNEGKPVHSEILNRSKSGRDYWMELDIVPLKDEKDTITGFMSIQLDITERKEAEALLKDQAERTELALAAGELGLWDWNVATGKTLFDERWAAMLGEKLEFLTPYVDEWSKRCHPDDLPLAKEALRKHFDGEAPIYECLQRMKHRDGSWRWIMDSGKVFSRTPFGEPLRMVGTHKDVTNYHNQQLALKEAKIVAEQASQAKADFLANMSHEIRTPMNAVIGMTELLQNTALNTDQAEFVSVIHSSGETLLVLINDILDFSKIESGSLEFESIPVHVRDCVESALELIARPAAEKNIDLLVSIEPDVPVSIYGDKTRLFQILTNLLSNAVKFTEKGEVLVSISNTTSINDITDNDGLHFAIRDTGIGIPENRLDRLFKSFSQVDASTTRQYGGTGLGLAICSRLVDLMNGRIWVESSPQKGSTFHFEIPLKPAPEPAEVSSITPSADIKGKRLMIVDDNSTNRRILSLQAQNWGLIPFAAASAKEAISWLDRGDHFDLAIIDVQMPEMNGYQLAAEIRKRLDPTKLPIIVHTSLGDDGKLFEGLKVSKVLTKPVKSTVLYDALLQSLQSPAADAKDNLILTPIESNLAIEHPFRILLTEDLPINQRVALLLLQRQGYAAAIAENGIEALKALERESFDVIFMDVQMPEMDGLTCTRMICEKYPLEKRPWIIAMTANAQEGDHQICLDAGMDDYITKPISGKIITQALIRASQKLSKRRQSQS